MFADTSKAYAVRWHAHGGANPWPSYEDIMERCQLWFSYASRPARPFPAANFCPLSARPIEEAKAPTQEPGTILAQSPIYHPQKKLAPVPPIRKMTKHELIDHGYGRIVRETRTVGPLTYQVARFVRYHGIPKLYHRVLAEYKLWRSHRFEQTNLLHSTNSHPIF